MERLKSALENLDQVIDRTDEALLRHFKNIDTQVEARADKRIKAATETAERVVKQAQTRESQAIVKVSKQRELTSLVAGRLDQAIGRLERMIAEA